MPNKWVAKQRIIKGNKLKCSICNNDTFWSRETLMNTTRMTFFKLDWLNKSATNYVCNNYGHVLWFMKKNK
jgi:hypothetical protein